MFQRYKVVLEPSVAAGRTSTAYTPRVVEMLVIEVVMAVTVMEVMMVEVEVLMSVVLMVVVEIELVLPKVVE